MGDAPKLGEGMTTVANKEEDTRLAPVSLGKPVFDMPTWAKLLAVVLVVGLPVLAEAIPTVPVLATIASIVVTLGAAFGIISPGARKKNE